jgi:hypothetical protein
VALAHNKVFNNKVQKFGGLDCPVSKEAYRLNGESIILQATGCKHFLSLSSWYSMKNTPYGAFCPFCKQKDDYNYAWTDTLLANQKFLMDFILKSDFNSGLGRDGEENSRKNLESCIEGAELSYSLKAKEQLVEALKNPTCDNFYKFLLKAEEDIPRAKQWELAPAKTFPAEFRPWRPQVTRDDSNANLRAMYFSQIYHSVIRDGRIVEPAEIDRIVEGLLSGRVIDLSG